MIRWLRAGCVAMIAVAIFSYAADWLLFKVQGSPVSKFTVSYFVTAPLKNNKEERDYLGSQEVPCSMTLYPQGGYTPCWYLRRHTNQVTAY